MRPHYKIGIGLIIGVCIARYTYDLLYIGREYTSKSNIMGQKHRLLNYNESIVIPFNILNCSGEDYCKSVASEWFILENIIFHNGRVTLFSKSPSVLNATVNELQLKAHVYHGYMLQTSTKVYNRVEFNGVIGAFNRSTCTLMIDEPAFILNPWLSHIPFHMHNDNLLPLTFMSTITDTEFMNSTLFLFQGDPTTRVHDLPLFKGFLSIFKYVYSAENLLFHPSSIVCFRKLHWGVGMRIYYKALQTLQYSPNPYYQSINQRFKRQMYQKLQISPIDDEYRHKNRVIFIKRHDFGRRLSEDQLSALSKEFTRRGFEFTICCSSETYANLTEFLTLLSTQHIVIGAHGSGLTNSIYMSRGALIVELKLEYAFDNRLFEDLAMQNSIGHVYIDIRQWKRIERGAKQIVDLTVDSINMNLHNRTLQLGTFDNMLVLD